MRWLTSGNPYDTAPVSWFEVRRRHHRSQLFACRNQVFQRVVVHVRRKLVGDLRKAQNELEDYYFADQEEVLAAIKDVMPADRQSYLNKKSIAHTEKMMQRWDQLAKYLIVKYNDQVVKRIDENGQFLRWGNETPGYDQQFIDAVGKSTGDRYKLKEVIERRER